MGLKMKIVLIIVSLLFIIGCKPIPKFTGRCSKCDYSITIQLFRGRGGYKIPRVGCDNDGTILIWLKDIDNER